ncbi:hypothetical protein GBZ26_03925 [Azospirillum formosense]|uniref:Uncharacterized protein n=1 Tax=Azospirillum formosense TaxID=861533 RepID=A0ABX2KRQ4_9PROT|nr:hypothetical protein [Azospirillum formosense]MBY3755753.1 hypothetical protein [Azospirillum formosense]NUB18372.1 hypothetical protein [Azospirillum formosense]
MRIAALSLPSLLASYQRLAACCAAQEPVAPDDLDCMLGNLEHVLACAEVETPEDLIAKGRFLLTYRNDPAMIPAAALDTLAAGIERLCAATIQPAIAA